LPLSPHGLRLTAMFLLPHTLSLPTKRAVFTLTDLLIFFFPVFRSGFALIKIGLHDVLFNSVSEFYRPQFFVFIVQLLTEDLDLRFHDCDLVHITALRFVLPYGS
jgi:hypothetical protein